MNTTTVFLATVSVALHARCDSAGTLPTERRETQLRGARCDEAGRGNPGGFCDTGMEDVVVMRRTVVRVAPRCAL